MTTHLGAHPRTSGRVSSRGLRAGVRGTAGSLLRHAIGLVGGALSLAAAGLDGLVIGLPVAAIVAAFASGVERHLGLPWPVESLVASGGLLGLSAVGAAMALLLRRGALWLGQATERRLGGPDGNRRRWPRRGIAVVLAIVGGLPAGWLGACAVILALAFAGSETAFGLFLPSGMLSSYVIVAGAVGAVVGVANRLAGLAFTRRFDVVRRLAITALVIVALAISSASILVLLSPGSTASVVPASPAFDGPVTGELLPDPGLPGPYPVRATSYGSGTDARRSAFGADAAVITPTVDASRVLRPMGFGSAAGREAFWGFGPSALPLNGLVWLPDGAGPFPLVLMVHGNHAMGDFSEPGYAYLGEHLASRGFIAVSIDEDFLNGSWASDWAGTEQVVRAWLLLLHLDQWRTWNASLDSPFHGLVDLHRVALIGHSRGGEASSLAASLATDATPPRSDLEPWPTGLDVKAVVAIAPSDGQYGSPVSLKGIDLLELAGGYDGDSRGWAGLRQYARTTVADGSFKAALWSYRSNHGQFNTVWGRSDHGALGGAILNLAPILDPEDQQDVSKTAITAFLEASLHGTEGYRELFQRPMRGRSWLPADDVYLVRSMDEAFVPLTTGDPSQPIDGVSLTTAGFDRVRASLIPLRAFQLNQLMLGLNVRWLAGSGSAAVAVAGLADDVGDAGAAGLRVALANGTQPVAGTSPDAALPLDPRIELTTTDGVTVSLPLSTWGALPPPLVVTLVKNELLGSIGDLGLAVDWPFERVLQTYEIPLADFATADPSFDPARLASVRILVDRGVAGSLWIAELGLVPG